MAAGDGSSCALAPAELTPMPFFRVYETYPFLPQLDVLGLDCGLLHARNGPRPRP